MMKKTKFFTAASAFVLLSSPALAADQMSMSEIQAQLQQLSAQVQNLSNVVEQQNQTIKQQEAELNAQKQASAEAMEQVVANIKPAAGHVDTSGVKISMKPLPKIESADGDYSFQPTGRMHFDAVHYDDDASNRSSGTDVRRARLGAKGKLGNDVSYKGEIDFGGNSTSITDFYLKYSGLDSVDLVAGHQKPKMGLQQQTSSNSIQLLERSAPINAFTQGRRLGLNVLTGDDNWSLGVGAFGEGAGVNGSSDDEDSSIEGRGSINLLGLSDDQTDNILHLGAGYSYRDPGDGEARFRARPGTGDGPRIVDTGTINNVDDVSVYGLELAGVFGPFSAQAEYLKADVSVDGAADADFDGYYAQAGWVLSGETRSYKGKSGKFGGVKPDNPFNIDNGEWGAFELVARYENLDLNDTGAGITGGEVDMITGGVNWYLNNNVRVMGNIISVDSDDNAVVANDDPTIYSLRTQWSF